MLDRRVLWVSLILLNKCVILIITQPLYQNNDYVQLAANSDYVFWIGAIFANHRTYVAEDYDACGDLNSIYTIHDHAYLFAIDWVNKYLLQERNFSLGLWALDSCDNDILGLQQGIKFIEKDDRGMCYGTNKFSKNPFPVYALTGVTGSDVAIQVSSLAQFYCIPTVWAYSTSPLLDNKNKFKLFHRTVASDDYQTTATVSLLLKNNWTYVSVIYEDTSYGAQLYETFKDRVDELQKGNDDRKIVYDSYKLEDDYQDDPEWQDVKRFLNHSDAHVLLVFMDYSMTQYLFELINDKWYNDLQGKFLYIGADGWSNNYDVVAHKSRLLNMSIATEPYVTELNEYKNYLSNLLLRNMTDPWLIDLVGEQNKCCSDAPVADLKCSYSKQCTGNETVNISLADAGVGRAHYVVEAIVVIARAFRALHDKLCNSLPGACAELLNITGRELYNAIAENGTFDTMPNLSLSFPKFHKGNGPPKYTIFQYQCDALEQCKWVPIGFYDDSLDSNALKLNVTAYIIPELDKTIKKRVEECFPVCPLSKRRVVLPNNCWKCSGCDNIFSTINRNTQECNPCSFPTVPTDDFSACVLGQSLKFDFDNAALVSTVVSTSCGLIIVALAAVIMFIHWKTPIIENSVRILSCLLLASLGVQFIVPLLMLLQSTPYLCSILTCLWTISATVSIASLFARACRITDLCYMRMYVYNEWPQLQTFTIYKTKLILPIAIQAVIVVCWLILVNSHMSISRLEHGPPFYVVALCADAYQRSSLVLLVCPIVLVILSGCIGFRMRHLDMVFLKRESRLLYFHSFVLLCCYVLMLPVQFAVAKQESVILAHMLTRLMVPLVTIFFFIFPTIYVILFEPHKNTPEYINRRRRVTYITSQCTALRITISPQR